MQLIKVGAAALNQTPLDWDGNQVRIIGAINEARKQGVSLLCLPELCISGYGCEDAFQSSGVLRLALAKLQSIALETKDIAVSLGLPLIYNKALFNVAALAVDGRILGFAAKRHLCGDGIHYEPRWFKSWPVGVRAEFALDGEYYPIGDIYFSINGIKIGFEICEDAWVADRPGRMLAARAIDIILNPSASHFAFDKDEVRQRFALEGSRAFGVGYVSSNLLGCEAGRIIFDGDCLIAACGKLLARSQPFSYRDWLLVESLIDLDLVRLSQSKLVSYLPSLNDDPNCVLAAVDNFPQPLNCSAVADLTPVARLDKFEQFSQSVALGLFDYLRKSKSRGFVVSLSGGADSSSVSCLVYLMVHFAAAELGLDGLRAKLAHISAIVDLESPREILSKLLSCVYQRTENNSQQTQIAARSLAEELGAEFYTLDIDHLVKGYLDLLAGALNRTFSWQNDDAALQNIQARVRVPAVWFLANIKQALLLTTSNRSEAAVGYATMDGDTSGGLNPIGGIDKAFIRKWLSWMEQEGPAGIAPLKSLALVNCQQPSAELRPLGQGQTDEADLMPYQVLDVIERLAVRDKLTPLEVYRSVSDYFKGSYRREDLAAWVQRFYLLWCRNQWKRERYAPSFHLDDENLDPKTWCRFPILSGNYQTELAELRNYLQSNS